MLGAIVDAGSEVGVYWRSNNAPRFPKEFTPSNLIWEPVVRESDAEIQKDLLRQYEHGVMVLCAPGETLQTSNDPEVLRKNLSVVDITLEWRRTHATHIPVFAAISIDSALLTSTEIDGIKDAYAAKALDGIILRVCVPGRIALDAKQLRAIKKFIGPWAESHRTVLFDGDLSVFLWHFLESQV